MKNSRLVSARRVVGAVVAFVATLVSLVAPAGAAHADPGDYVRMQNAETRQYLTIGNANNGDGVPAIQWTSLSGSEQRWTFVKVHDVAGDYWDEWVIKNAHSGKCLAIPNGSTADGAGAIQWTCGTNPRGGEGIDDQRWLVTWDVILGGYLVHNFRSDKCLAIPAGNTTLGVQAIQWSCANDLDQRWWLF
ncbi:RICIN domain-containing protein [Kribbella sp. NPDC003505]|uniref:RICIN domain-containing protein n=1 Tax=Kribbella sp. NPDC003505 TaxID=3154448 RepID=UPI0033BF82A1